MVGRLKKRADFLNARNGARSHERAFVLQLVRRKPDVKAEKGLRVGFTVTKKVGNAVERNRIKRRFREAVRRIEPIGDLDCCDAVMIARREALAEPFDALVTSLGDGLNQACRKIDQNKHTDDVAKRNRTGQKRRDAGHGANPRKRTSGNQG